MPGFPTRIVRPNLGPEYENERKVLNEKHEVDAAFANRLMHQTTGMNLLSAMASMVVSWDGADVSIVRHSEAWNVELKTSSPYDVPLPTRSGQGVYLLNYNASYPDELGTLRAIDVQDGCGWVVDPESDAHLYLVKVKRVDANTLEARVYGWEVGVSSDWALVDRDFRVVWW